MHLSRACASETLGCGCVSIAARATSSGKEVAIEKTAVDLRSTMSWPFLPYQPDGRRWRIVSARRARARRARYVERRAPGRFSLCIHQRPNDTSNYRSTSGFGWKDLCFRQGLAAADIEVMKEAVALARATEALQGSSSMRLLFAVVVVASPLLCSDDNATGTKSVSILFCPRTMMLSFQEMARFYQSVDRDYDGAKSAPWEGGQYGFVRDPKGSGGGVIYTRFHEGIDIRPCTAMQMASRRTKCALLPMARLCMSVPLPATQTTANTS